MQAAAEKVVPIVGQIGLPAFLARMVEEVEAGVATIAAEVRIMAQQVIAGGRAPIVEPTPQPILPAPPAVERLPVFLTKNVRWTEKGEERFSHAYRIEQLPVGIAKRALEMHAGVDPEAEFAKKIRHGGANAMPRELPRATVNLDEMPAESPQLAAFPVFSNQIADAENYRAAEGPYFIQIPRGPEPTPGPEFDDGAPA